MSSNAYATTDIGTADAARWFANRTTVGADWVADDLAVRKSGPISVVIPARNEASTIGNIVAGIRGELMERVALIDELIVVDSDSTDDTAGIAARAGATVYAARQIRADQGSHPGKGEALWKSQFVSSGELLVFIDADLVEWGAHFVVGLLGPLVTNPQIQLVKGFYDRWLTGDDGGSAPQGGRVTELVARPLLNLHWPALTHVVQPLAGEWAIRRDTFTALSVPIGYGVELAALIDVYERGGLDAIAQVDLASRAHSHQSVHDLGLMAAEILAVAGRRTGRGTSAAALWQFDRTADPCWRARPVPMLERPPVRSLGRDR